MRYHSPIFELICLFFSSERYRVHQRGRPPLGGRRVLREEDEVGAANVAEAEAAAAAAAAGGGAGGGGQVAGDLQYEGKKEDAKVTLLPKKNVDQDSSSKLKSQSFIAKNISINVTLRPGLVTVFKCVSSNSLSPSPHHSNLDCYDPPYFSHALFVL